MTKDQTFDHPTRGHVAILYYDVTNDRFQVVPCDDVDTAIPATAKATVASALAHGYDGTLWRKQPLVWGYSDHWSEDLGGTQSNGGTYSKISTPVPAGYVYVASAISYVNDTGSRGQLNITALVNGVNVYLLVNTGPTQSIPDVFLGNLVLGEGDTVRVRQYSCLDNDVILAGVIGYLMKLDM